MRKLFALCVALSLVGPVVAQDSTVGLTGLTFGQFATTIASSVTSATEAVGDPESALGYLRGYGFVPDAWQAGGEMTHGDLAHALARAGIVHEVTDPKAAVLRSDLDAVINRDGERLRAYFSGTEVDDCTHGYFAQLLVRTISPPQDALPDQQTSLDRLKSEELVPLGWLVPEILTHGEMKDVLARFGIIYETVDQDEPVSVPFAEAIIRRELSMLKDYWAKRMGHGFIKSHVLDQGIDRAVSPSDYYYRAHVHNPG